ncbi:protein of unknown function [Paenibacillus tianmuensis]|uniref:DUF4304 domain-containing protein n=1 Tax=Paenibacillus tianmuensis TaxID=624147 RepID=A0A1G4R3E9_9BACL|nr:DUF4304 domain-containing protein [Paenibacillus tianmuensis]SCW51382.1 protein of unknown function [Paenibacillus tianmuensis]
MENKQFDKGTKPREIFVYTCQRIAEPLLDLGFKYYKSKNEITKKDDLFIYSIDFQPSIKLGSTSFLVHVSVYSNHLKEWRLSKDQTQLADDVVFSTSLARLTKRADDWPLYSIDAYSERERVIAEITQQINEYALPFFERFKNPGHLAEDVKKQGFLPHRKNQQQLLRKDLATNFIECFGGEYTR